MNQTISATGRIIDEATFVLAEGGSLAPIPFLAEIVDDVIFTTTPEPATVGVAANVCQRSIFPLRPPENVLV